MTANASTSTTSRTLTVAAAIVLTIGAFLAFQPFVAVELERTDGDWRSWSARIGAAKQADNVTQWEGLLQEPTTTAKICRPDDGISKEYGSHLVRLSRVHEGSGWRLHQKFSKASRGELLKVAVIGGSVSAGHGAIPGVGRYKYGAIAQPDRWHQHVMRYLNATYPQVTFQDGARPGTDSSFFAWCYTSSISTDVDLVFVELAVNDENNAATTEAAETLLRSLLQLESSPAVIFVESFALRTESGQGGMTNGQNVHDSLAAFYDVAQISVRGPLLPALFEDPKRAQPYFLGDPRHIAKPLHAFLGSMVVAYLEEERCRMSREQVEVEDGETERKDSLWPSTAILGQVPKLRMTDTWTDDKHYPVQPPTCAMAGETLEPVEEAPGWRLFVWQKTKRYLETRRSDQEIKFKVDVREGGVGDIAVGYLRSAQYNLGLLRCEVGGQQATLDGFWEKSTSLGQTQVVATGLQAGRHTLICRTLPPGKDGRTAFRIMSVMSL